MKREFLTHFDTHYAACGLVMLESLFQWGDDIRATVLCLDETVAPIITSELGERVRIVRLEELADFEPALRPLKAFRAPWEFYATHKPVLMDWAVRQHSPEALVTYTDADTFYFANPAPVFEEAGTASIVLSPHRFNAFTKNSSVYGTYNAGFGLWRNDAMGRKCLQDWTRDCLEWCRNWLEKDGRFMNQGYLNQWPSLYENVHILTHPGVNLAPWNIDTHVIEQSADGVLVDGQPLIFYHFSGLSRTADGLWQTYAMGDAIRHDTLQQDVYAPYLQALDAMSLRLQTRYGIAGIGSVRSGGDTIPVVTFKR